MLSLSAHKAKYLRGSNNGMIICLREKIAGPQSGFPAFCVSPRLHHRDKMPGLWCRNTGDLHAAHLKETPEEIRTNRDPEDKDSSLTWRLTVNWFVAAFSADLPKAMKAMGLSSGANSHDLDMKEAHGA